MTTGPSFVLNRLRSTSVLASLLVAQRGVRLRDTPVGPLKKGHGDEYAATTTNTHMHFKNRRLRLVHLTADRHGLWANESVNHTRCARDLGG